MPRFFSRSRREQKARRRLTLGFTPRIVGLVALTALVSGGIIAYLGVHNNGKALKDQTLADAQTQADLVAGIADSYMGAAREPLDKLAHAPHTALALTSADSGQPVVPLAVPVLDEAGGVLAAIVGALSLDAAADSPGLAERQPVGRIALVDRRGGATVLAQHDSSRILQPLTTSDATFSTLRTVGAESLPAPDPLAAEVA